MASASTEQSFPSSSLSSRTVTESTETASTSTEQSFLSWPPSPPPTGPCVILGRVALLHYDAEHVPKQLTVRLAATPRVSTLTVPLSLHPAPDYNDYDRHPYVLAAGDAGLLLHVSRAPSIGFNLERDPPGILLVAQARDFSPSTAPGAPAGEVTAASVVRVPDRNIPHQHGISSIRSVGLVSRPGSGGADYMVAELRIPDCADPDNSRAVLYYFRSGTDSWGQRALILPGGGGPMPSFHDVVAHDGELWWVDLASGLFGCDPFAEDPVLRRVPFQFTYPAAGLPQDIEIETRRMVRVSQGKLRFVELACARHDQPEETLVVIWTLTLDPDGFTWWKHQRVASLASIWESDRYIQLDLGEQVPELGLLHPGDADLVYFFLNRNLFSVDVHESMIKEYVHGCCNLVRVFFGTSPLPQISWRYVLAWELPPSLDNVIIPDKDTDADSTKGSESSNSRDVVDLNRPPIPSLNLGPVPMSLD